jgi:hypothetical protein
MHFIYVQNTMKKTLFWIILIGVVAFSFFIMQNPTSPFAIGIKSTLGIPTQDLIPETIFSGYTDTGIIVDQDSLDT